MKPTTLLLLVIVSIFTSARSHAESPELILANAHGLSDWNKVETLQFTFYVARKPPVSRTWLWNLSENSVTRTAGGESRTIQLQDIETGNEADTDVHKQFINDTFWLLFPFSIAWSSPQVTDHGEVTIELNGETTKLRKLTALWPSDEGYTPGDAYDIFIDEEQKIHAWNFRKANRKKKGRFFEWKDPKDLGPIRIYESYHRQGETTPMIQMKDLKITLAD
ncbi:MAG: hypothetical protein AAGH40_12410 [Verrucomicrobiota bacterium]